MSSFPKIEHKWWKESVVYQIYPSSFKDNNGDGWGDVKGITSKLDYLKELGVDVIWVSPIYKSPQVDMGYDIADYKVIDPMYGSIEDVDDLIAELKKRDMKLMMDLVANHTSDQHAWFIESLESKESPKRDWYIWKPPKGHDADGKPLPPNNWMQLLGDANSAWTYSEKTGEFFLSLFTPEQPDLNWENAAVRAAVHDIMKFWCDRGACGFRLDVINLISKDQSFPDAPPNMPPGHKYHDGGAFYINGPRLHEFLHEMHDEVLSKYDCMTVGEMPGVSDIKEIIRTVGSTAGELNMIFIFDIVNIDFAPPEPKFSLTSFDASDMSRILGKWQTAMIQNSGWNSLFVSNHDQPRSVGRYVSDADADRIQGAKLLALMQSTLCGTLYVYQGDELGMRNVPASWDPAVDYKDIESINFWKKSKVLHANDEKALAEARHVLNRKARDNARTPMQWTSEPSNAGFSDPGVKPWMRVNEDSGTVNAEAQLKAEVGGADVAGVVHGGMSVFRFWQRALANRKLHKDIFIYGNFEVVGADQIPRQVFAYVRDGGDGAGRGLVILNFSAEKVEWNVPDEFEVLAWVFGNYDVGKIEKPNKGRIELEPWEGILGKCLH